MKRESTEDIVIECDLPHTPEKVWRALTDQDLLGRWLTPADLQPEVGARFKLPPETSRSAGMIDCEVIEAVPQRTLRWRQTEKEAENDSSIESVVSFELRPNPHGTHLRIVHDQFRRVEIEARAAVVNVVQFAPRTSSAAPIRRPKIVCTRALLRRAA